MKTILFTKRHEDGTEERVCKNEADLTPEEISSIYDELAYHFDTSPGVVQHRFIEALILTIKQHEDAKQNPSY